MHTRHKRKADSMCKVSVLVPVYNVKTYLSSCLDSLAAQTLHEMEFICIDDGSTDGSEKLLDAYAEKDARFHVIHKRNSGYGASMNVGLRAARGAYIGIVESDDFASRDMFAALYNAAEAHQADVVMANHWNVTETETTLEESFAGHPYDTVFSPIQEDASLLLAPPVIWSGLYRRDFLLKHDVWFNETPGASYQDTSFVFLARALAQRLLLLKEGYLHYRKDNAASSVHSTGKLYCIIDEYDAVERYLDTHPVQESQKLHKLSARLFYQNFQFNEERIGKENWVAFWQRAYPKLQEAQRRGYFQGNLGENMGAWMVERFTRYQEKELLFQGFLALCKSGPRCYLYGAGKVARRLLAVLQNHCVQVAGFLVSDAAENPSSITALPVDVMDGSSADREHDIIIIAITPRKPAVQQEIFFALEEAGYRNVIILAEELRQALAGA